MIDAFIDAWFRAVGRRGEEAITEREGREASTGVARVIPPRRRSRKRWTARIRSGEPLWRAMGRCRLATFISRASPPPGFVRVWNYFEPAGTSSSSTFPVVRFILLLPSVRSFDTSHTGRMACARVTPLVSKGPKSEYHFDSSKSIHIYRNSCRATMLLVKQMFSSGRQFENSHRKRPRESCSKLITSYEARHEGEDRGSSPPI